MESKSIIISQYLTSYILGRSTSQEIEIVEKWLEDSKNNAYFQKFKQELLFDISSEFNIEHSKEKKDFFEMIDGKSIHKNLKSRRIKMNNLLAYVGVVSIIVTIPLLFLFLKEDKPINIATNSEHLKIKIDNPVLITSNGDKVLLMPNEPTQVLKENNGVNVNIKGNSLSYDIDKSLVKKVTYNTIRVPKCGNYQFTMLDGTKVWLNSNTTLKYPVPFHKNKREVVLNGEAYFEVTKDKKNPFIVNMGTGKVKVLGTEFNINNYKGKEVTTTLVSGKVQISDNNSNQAILLPGQQSVFENRNINVRNVDPYDYISWKEGYFLFNKVSIDEILRELSNWYDFEYFYQNEMDYNTPLRIKVKKYDNLKDVLKLIENTTDVRFRIKDKTIIVFK